MPAIQLITLGTPNLKVNDRAVRVYTGMSRTVEVLAYLLQNAPVSLEQIQTEVFSNISAVQARKYFHSVRKSISRSIPGLEIVYESEQRTYHLLHRGLEISWDALEVRKALKLGGEMGLKQAIDLYSGTFMPHPGGSWAVSYRKDLEWNMTIAGQETVEDLFKLKRYDICIEITNRLLEINPLDVSLSMFLVHAVRLHNGTQAAHQELERLVSVFDLHGEIPGALNKLRGGWCGQRREFDTCFSEVFFNEHLLELN